MLDHGNIIANGGVTQLVDDVTEEREGLLAWVWSEVGAQDPHKHPNLGN